MDLVKVKDHVGLLRDPRTDQIINTNKGEYQQYMARREARRLEKERALNAELDLDTMKGDLGEIKSLLKELVNGN